MCDIAIEKLPCSVYIIVTNVVEVTGTNNVQKVKCGILNCNHYAGYSLKDFAFFDV
jgi:hypothetical protein